ncbi:tetratricopeptide repeat protein [Burkholderia pyrrocinia]|uniref:tetratricopeptide repeat protein n=1 Tax=Burkholderia pyrrocinia TaxID=60550 RepID=UPI001589291E|nr:tetratricopeptide repeat protein [Burkholderia pyrrocinia]
MTRLPKKIQDELDALSEQGNVLCDASKFDEAIQRWSAALELLPEPRVDWEAYTWLSASIGDAQYQLEEFDAARQSFFDALNGPGGQENPFVHYRLGQSQVRLGDEEQGVASLLKAYMLDGDEIFDEDGEGEKYLQMLRDRKLVG